MPQPCPGKLQEAGTGGVSRSLGGGLGVGGGGEAFKSDFGWSCGVITAEIRIDSAQQWKGPTVAVVAAQHEHPAAQLRAGVQATLAHAQGRGNGPLVDDAVLVGHWDALCRDGAQLRRCALASASNVHACRPLSWGACVFHAVEMGGVVVGFV